MLNVATLFGSPLFLGYSYEQIEAALAQVDLAAIDAEIGKLQQVPFFKWDGITPVLGYSAEYLKQEWLKCKFWDGISDIYLRVANGSMMLYLTEEECTQHLQNEKEAIRGELVVAGILKILKG